MTYTLLVMINQLDLTCTHSGDLSPLVQTIQAQATHHQRQAAVLISGFKSVALLIWETGAFAIFDSHMHAQFGAIMSYAAPGPTSSTGSASWLSNMVQKYFNGALGLCTLTICNIRLYLNNKTLIFGLACCRGDTC